jgi:hypothetical protein
MFATSAAVFSLLLILTGVAKIRSPGDVGRALTALGFPIIRRAGGLIGVVEVAVGATALFWRPSLIAQGFLFVVFGIWVLVALRREVPIASCGCLGKDDTPPTVAHIVLNAIAASVSLAAAGGPALRIDSGLEGAAQMAVVAIGVFLSYIVLTDGARLIGARSR